MDPGEQFCAGCCSICCIGCTEALSSWLQIAGCGQTGSTRQTGCCGSCCKKSFDDDDFFLEEEQRRRAAAAAAVNTQPPPQQSMSQTPQGGIVVAGDTGDGPAETAQPDVTSLRQAAGDPGDAGAHKPAGY